MVITDRLVVAAPIAAEAIPEPEAVLGSVHARQTLVAIVLATAGLSK
jgi:hypothetical protein